MNSNGQVCEFKQRLTSDDVMMLMAAVTHFMPNAPKGNYGGRFWHCNTVDMRGDTWRLHVHHPKFPPRVIDFPKQRERTPDVDIARDKLVDELAEIIGCTRDDVILTAKQYRFIGGQARLGSERL